MKEKMLTTQRLELQAAVTAVRLKERLLKFWTLNLLVSSFGQTLRSY